MVKVTKLESPNMVKGFVGAAYQVNEEATLDLQFNTESGPLLLANVKCWLVAEDLPGSVGHILLSRPIMIKLGYDPLTLLKDAAIISDEYDMQDAVANSGAVKAVLFAQQEMVDDLASEEAELVPMELDACFPEVNKTSGDETRAEVKAVLDSKVAEAVDYGCGDEFASRLSELFVLYSDVFRLSLGKDPPVSMPPLKVHLKEGAKPIRCKSRRYSLPQRQFMQKHVRELEKAGFIYRNPASRWASAPLIVRKPHTKDEFRMTVDLRPVNAQTEQIVWPMPMLEVVIDHLAGATCFFLLDFFQGYWQFALDPSCQEIFSFLTDTGVYTSTRVMQGGSDSVFYCQSTVQQMFSKQLYHGLLAWLDDLLGYHREKSGLLDVLADVLEICQEKV
ncbi:hypothetical protein AeRB84_018324 [Aphanomyces euteiches]|nr:hypothetical protein AeRB84_018324 [Aphanomyces euteiches]